MKQRLAILKYMIDHKEGITPQDALKHTGCMRLSSQIYSLKNAYGIAIDSKLETAEKKNKYGYKPTYSRYWIANPKSKQVQEAVKQLEKKNKIA